MLFIAKFADLGDVIVDADSAEVALEAIARHGVAEIPLKLIEVTPGVFCAEIQWALPDDDEGADENPANYSDSGIVLEPLDGFADWLDVQERAAGALEVATPAPDPG